MEGHNIQRKTPLEKGKFYKWHLIGHRLRHGLFLMSLTNLLRRVGITLLPFWIELEGENSSIAPMPKDDVNSYWIKRLNSSEIIQLFDLLGWNKNDLQKRLNSTYGGYGLYQGEEMAAFTMMWYESFEFMGKKINLNPHEIYLENMYTFEAFRGRNLAAYLRSECYRHLKAEGKTRFYSITNYFNKSSLRFKQKLNAKHLELWLHLGLFKRFRWNFLMKSYGNK